MRVRSRGFAILSVMAILLVGVSAALGIGWLMVSQNVQAKRLEFQNQARRYADNAIEAALAKIEKLEPGSTFREDVSVPPLPGDRSDALGRITFSESETYHSINNSGGNTTVTFNAGDFHRVIPKSAVYLLAEGRYEKVRVYEEALLAIPPFDYALASSGSLEATGTFLVGSLDDPSALADGVDSPAFQKALRRASLASNSQGSPALNLTRSSGRVMGNLVSPGKIAPGSGVIVEGEVEEGHRPVGLPEIDLHDLDPAGKPLLLTLDESEVTSALEVKGYARRTGDLTIRGDLKLSEGILYVDGNFSCSGSVSGLGVIAVSGKTSLSAVRLNALQQLGLLSQGDLTVTGRPGEKSTLVGLVYTKGNLSLSDVTVVGAVVGAGPSGATMRLHNVNALKSPKGVQFAFEQGWVGGTQSKPIAGTLGGQVVVSLKDTSKKPADFAPPKSFDPNTELQAVYVGGAQDGQDAGPVSGYTQSAVRNFVQNIRQQIPTAQPDPDKVVSAGKVDLDLNRFLKLADKLKVVYRRTYYGIPNEPTGTS